MTAAEAMAIRDEAISMGLTEDDDMRLLNRLGVRGEMTIIPPSLPQAVEASQAKEPVVGGAMEDAARRIRRKMRSAA